MAYTLKLTDEEVSHLGWLVNHGYFPEETYNAMHLADGQDEDAPGEKEWEIPEHAAWAISQAREDDPHGEALFACTGGPLLDKLVEFEGRIV